MSASVEALNATSHVGIPSDLRGEFAKINARLDKLENPGDYVGGYAAAVAESKMKKGD